MTERTYGDTKDCRGCRNWSEMVASCSGGGPIEALCLSQTGERRGKWVTGRTTCAAWQSGHYGAIDEPGQDPTIYEENAEPDGDAGEFYDAEG